ncbi:ABC transporter substrate-binding protein [Massilia sp. erpn]|uniref:substrate-binding periplasmic protein n=1 Tax=Massilia sp. erpn TaxID=2738142 RepID=UPI0021075CAA|nr:transporter substrate-binding domain-containing protein [Massilia sp. erpn]
MKRKTVEGSMRGKRFRHLFHIAVVVLLALVLLLFSGQAGARELLVVGAHFERVFERTPEGEFTGLGPEVVRILATRLGHTARFEIYPWARAQAILSQGKADILVGPYKSFERVQRMAFSRRPFYQDQMVFYALNTSGIVWHGDFATLADHRIVIMNGWTYGEQFEQARPMLKVSVANSVESGLKMVEAQHVVLFASNRRNTEPVLAKLGLAGQMAPLAHVIQVQDGYFAFPKRQLHEALRREFDQAFAAMVESGELKRLGQRFDVTVP